jgi:hypothetical protein
MFAGTAKNTTEIIAVQVLFRSYKAPLKPAGLLKFVSCFALVELLEVFDLLFFLGGKIEDVITAIFRNHSVGVEYWNVEKDIVDTFVNVFISEQGIIEFPYHLRKQFIK